MSIYHKKLQQLINQHDIHGDLQWKISKELSLSGSSSLFEHLNDADAKEVFEIIDLRGAEQILEDIKAEYSKSDTQSDNENEGASSAMAESSSDDEQQPGGAVAATPGARTTPAPSFQLREVYDAESGELVQRTPEQQAAAHSLYSLMKMADLAQAILLKKFLDGNHHLDLGYSTKEDFYIQELGQSRSNVSRKLKVAEKFEGIIPVGNVAPVQHLTGDESANLETLNQIGLTKLYEVAKVEEADFDEVLTTGVVKFPDGREVPLEDIQMRTRTEVQNMMKSEIDGYKKRNAALLDQKAEVEAELNKAKSELEASREKQQQADRLNTMYGAKAKTWEGLETLIKEARESMHRTNKLMCAIKMPKDCPADLAMQIVELHRIIDAGRQNLMNDNLMAFELEPEVRIRQTTQFGDYTVDEETGEIIEQQPAINKEDSHES